MEQRAAISLRRCERPLRRHLNVIRRRRVERAVAADPEHGPAVGEDGLGGLRRAPRRFLDRRRDVIRNPVDLAGVEQGEGAQQRNAPHRVFVAFWPRVIAQHEPFEKESGRAALAGAHLPAALAGLLVGRPARIAADERQRRHAQHHHVDATIARAGHRIARHGRTSGLVGVPWPAPGRRTGLKCRDNAVGDLLVVVARIATGLAAASLLSACGSACDAHRDVLPFVGFWKHPLQPRIPADRGKGARSARPEAGPLRRADGVR